MKLKEKIKIENTNNKITETKFTQNDVLKGLMAMDEELRQYIRKYYA